MSQRPTAAELSILKVLWGRGPSTVRDVFDELNRTRKTGYTTVLKLLQIMHGKGLVQRDESSKTHVYRTAASEQQTQRHLVDDLISGAFGGSARKLVVHALDAAKSSPSELAEIRKLLDEMKETEQ